VCDVFFKSGFDFSFALAYVYIVAPFASYFINARFMYGRNVVFGVFNKFWMLFVFTKIGCKSCFEKVFCSLFVRPGAKGSLINFL
jgi:hypothetical protein